MFKKLLAAVFAATLMAGTAWGATIATSDVTDAVAVTPSGQTDDFSTTAVAITTTSGGTAGITVDAGGTLNVDGALTFNLDASGTGVITVGGTLNNTVSITLGGGTGQDQTLTFSNGSTYTGAGTIELQNAANTMKVDSGMAAGIADVFAGTTLTDGTIELTGTTEITADLILTAGAAAGTVDTGTVTSITGEVDVDDSTLRASAATVTFGGDVTAGTLVSGAGNTSIVFKGATDIDNNYIIVSGKDMTLEGADASWDGTGTLTTNVGGTLYLDTAMTDANISALANGTLLINDGAVTLISTTADTVVGGNITMAAASTGTISTGTATQVAGIDNGMGTTVIGGASSPTAVTVTGALGSTKTGTGLTGEALTNVGVIIAGNTTTANFNGAVNANLEVNAGKIANFGMATSSFGDATTDTLLNKGTVNFGVAAGGVAANFAQGNLINGTASSEGNATFNAGTTFGSAGTSTITNNDGSTVNFEAGSLLTASNVAAGAVDNAGTINMDVDVRETLLSTAKGSGLSALAGKIDNLAGGSIVVSGSLDNLGSAAAGTTAFVLASGDATSSVTVDATESRFQSIDAKDGKIILAGADNEIEDIATTNTGADAVLITADTEFTAATTAADITAGGITVGTTSLNATLTVNGLAKTGLGTTILSGSAIDMAGTISDTVNVQTGGQAIVSDAGATIGTTGVLNLATGSDLYVSGSTGDNTISATLDLTGAGAVNIDTGSTLTIASTVTSGTVFTDDFATAAITGMQNVPGGMTNKEAFIDWLGDQGSDSIYKKDTLTYNDVLDTSTLQDGTVTIDGVERDRQDALANIGDYLGGATDFKPNAQLADNVYEAIKQIEDPASRYNTDPTMSQEEKDLIEAMAGLGAVNGQYHLFTSNAAYSLLGYAQGVDLASSLEPVIDTVRNFNKAMTNRSYKRGNNGQVIYDDCGVPVTMCDSFSNRIWAGYSGMWGDADYRDGDRGYKYDAHGINLGYDFFSANGFNAGMAFGYSNGDFDRKGTLSNNGDIDNYSFGLYGSWTHAGGFFTSIMGSYTYSKYDMDSTVDTIGRDRAKYHSDTWSVGGEAGYDIRLSQSFTLTPTVGLYWYNTQTNRFNTRSDLGFFRRGMRYERSVVELPVQVTAKYDICMSEEATLSLVAQGGYAYNFNNKGTKVSAFDMNGTGASSDRWRKPGRNSWNVGGGVQYRYRNLDFGVSYEYYGRADYDSHNVSANVGLSF